MNEEARYLRAKRRVDNLKAFYIHLVIYILVNMMLFTINVTTNSNGWWFLYPLAGWGIGIAIHGLTVIAAGRFGPDWEERKIKQYMGNDK